MHEWKEGFGLKIANSHLDAQALREKFFSCEGRLNRKPFIMRLFGVIIVSTIVALLLYSLFFKGFGSQTAAEAATTIVSIIEVISIYTLVARRLHDIGFGRPLAVFYLVVGILQPFFFRAIAGLPQDSMEAELVQGINLFMMLLVVCLMMIRGNRGPNPYGEDPLGH